MVRNKDKGDNKRGLTTSFFTSTPKKTCNDSAGKHVDSRMGVVSDADSAVSNARCGDVRGDVRGNAHGDADVDVDYMADRVVERVVAKLTPVLQDKVSEAMDRIVVKLEERIAEMVNHVVGDKLEKLARMTRLNYYKSEQNEQYSRRETVKICNLAEPAGETHASLGDELVALLQEIGANVKKEDISVFHRNGMRKPNAPRPILMRLVSRQKKDEIMLKKRALKDLPNRKNVTIFEDLTPLRSRMLSFIKKQDTVDHAYTVNGGKILVALKENKERKVAVESPEDLRKIGIKVIPYQELGLEDLAACV